MVRTSRIVIMTGSSKEGDHKGPPTGSIVGAPLVGALFQPLPRVLTPQGGAKAHLAPCPPYWMIGTRNCARMRAFLSLFPPLQTPGFVASDSEASHFSVV